MAWSKEAVAEAVNKVGARAATDLEYRNLCVTNIHEAIQQETGLEVPSSFKIGVLDQSSYSLSIVLPKVQLADNELTEGELDSVAGGSKDGATDFFEGLAGGAASIMGADNTYANNSEGVAGNIIGQIVASPYLIIGS
ncbi:NHLP leader peptide family RiPP precursor [Paenibacillus sepulcri]|uniref:NHLP leader peptide family RiPP n=1 Tax=Paenibacillus sepulcri TaxID=359917 RepID=A0ABS7C946_9BACL|nr:NHLP leader peptide family RiPP precursor [Paenibacillus sepulcri]